MTAAASPARLRVLFVSRELPPQTGGGGLGTYVKTISAALAERGHDVHVLSCYPGQPSSTRILDGVTVHRRPIVRWTWFGRILQMPQSSARIRTAVSTRLEAHRLGVDFDVIQVPDFMAEGLLQKTRSSVPVVMRISSPLELIDVGDSAIGRLDRRLTHWLERAAAVRVDAVISPSSGTLAALEKLGWPSRAPTYVVRTPVDPGRFAGLGPAEQTRPVILAVGRVEHRKGLDRLVDAAHALLPRVPDLEVVLLGRSSGQRDGRPYAQWLAERAAGLGVRCTIPGQVPATEVRGFYERARVVAMVSRFDNLPNAALEALAAGRPVVCTAGTGVDEILAGSPAGAVTDGTPQQIADAAATFLCDPAAAGRAGREAKDLMARVCSPQAVAAQWETAVTAVLAGRCARRGS